METAFPYLSRSLANAIALENYELTPKQKRLLKEADPHYLNYFTKLTECKNNLHASHNVKCVMEVLKASPCQADFEDFSECVKYISSKSVPEHHKTSFFCRREELKLNECVNSLHTNILSTLAEFPVYPK